MLNYSTFTSIINISLWYIFTIISAFFSKLYLNETHDPFVLSIITFLYGAILFMFQRNSTSSLFEWNQFKMYLYLALFNVGTTLMTNIGINETSVSLTYMIKASEPIFVLIFSYYLLDESIQLIVGLTLLPICVGVSMIMFGEMNFTFIGVLSVITANISSASRNVFYKILQQQNNQVENNTRSSEKKSAFRIYTAISFVSVLIFIPGYVLRLIVTSFDSDNYSITISFALPPNNVLKYLFIGSFFNFLYNLFSLKVLTNLSAITHSIINIMKRVFIVFCSLIYFVTPITYIQLIGMLFADSGVAFYSIARIKSKNQQTTDKKHSTNQPSINSERKNKIVKYILLIFLICTIYGSFLYKIENKKTTQIYTTKTTNTSSKDYWDISPEKHQICFNKIQKETIDVYKKIIPKNTKYVHYMMVPGPAHFGIGDHLLRIGHEVLIDKLNLKVAIKTAERNHTSYQPEFLLENIKKDDVVLLQGGGNFGDIYRIVTILRNKLALVLTKNLLIFMPQTINYIEKKNALIDQQIYERNPNLVISVREHTSYKFAKEYFSKNKIILVPDLSFMVGNIPNTKYPTHDILFVRRHDPEMKYDKELWSSAYKMLDGKYTYFEKNWDDLRDDVTDFNILGEKRTELGTNLLSKGLLIVTDRLHVSVACLLMKKHHIIIDDKYNKIRDTREYAFTGKEECQQKYISGYYAKDPFEATRMAIEYMKRIRR